MWLLLLLLQAPRLLTEPLARVDLRLALLTALEAKLPLEENASLPPASTQRPTCAGQTLLSAYPRALTRPTSVFARPSFALKYAAVAAHQSTTTLNQRPGVSGPRAVPRAEAATLQLQYWLGCNTDEFLDCLEPAGSTEREKLTHAFGRHTTSLTHATQQLLQSECAADEDAGAGAGAGAGADTDAVDVVEDRANTLTEQQSMDSAASDSPLSLVATDAIPKELEQALCKALNDLAAQSGTAGKAVVDLLIHGHGVGIE